MRLSHLSFCALLFSPALLGCSTSGRQTAGLTSSAGINSRSTNRQAALLQSPVRNPGRVIHVLVALCDNKYQGIVPVPEQIGNGDDPANNLYWGAGYGVKNFFRKAKDWTLISDQQKPKDAVLERCVFKHKQRELYLVADAYRGREIKRSTIDFLQFASGNSVDLVEVSSDSGQLHLSAGADADLIAYVGHDGLMDFTLSEYPRQADDRSRQAVILSCASKQFFTKPLWRTGATPLLWTTNLMAPEAYTLKAAIDGWMLNENGDQVRKRAAEAYSRYQKCGIKGSMNLFASGW